MKALEWKLFEPKPEFKEGLHVIKVVPASYSTLHGVTYRVIDTVTKDDVHMGEKQLLQFWQPVKEAKDDTQSA